MNITGPCFKPDDRIRCKFDVADAVDGYVVDTNRAICVQPMLYAEGWVNLQIAIGSEAFKWKGKYYVGEYFRFQMVMAKGRKRSTILAQQSVLLEN